MMRTQTSIMQTQGSTAPLVIPPARQPGLLKSIGSRMASRREARAGRGEASASPGQGEQAAGRQLRQGEETQLPEADTPSERLPAELTGRLLAAADDGVKYLGEIFLCTACCNLHSISAAACASRCPWGLLVEACSQAHPWSMHAIVHIYVNA